MPGTCNPLLTRRRFLLACGAAAGAGVLAWSRRSRQLLTIERSGYALGSAISITVLHEDAAAGERAIDAAFAELARVERVMSLYRPESEVSRLNRDGVIDRPDPYLVQVLTDAHDMAERSGGAFDVTVQPLWRVYADAAKRGELPDTSTVELCRAFVDWRGVTIDAGAVRLRDNQAITLNGIAQGFAADRVMAALQSAGVRHALVNTGEIAASGQAWKVGIQHPREKDAYIAVADLAGRCLSSSGDYETAFSADRKYNHIFDPGTGRSPGELASVTVVAPTATAADALSTAIFVLGPERGAELAQSTPGVDLLLVLKDGRTLMTGGFPIRREVNHA